MMPNQAVQPKLQRAKAARFRPADLGTLGVSVKEEYKWVIEDIQKSPRSVDGNTNRDSP